ncbi:MAG: hypothetical protein ACQEXV_24975 [Bacillota bacterium]
MNSFFETGIPALVTAVTAAFLFIKLFIKTSKKTLVDNAIEVRSINLWEKFLEHILISFVIVVLLLTPVVTADISIFGLELIFIGTFLIFLISALIIIIYFIRFLCKGFKSKILNASILINFITIIFLPFQGLKIIINVDLLNKLSSDYIITFFVIVLLVSYIALVLAAYPKLFRFFNKKEHKLLKIEIISNQIEKLQTLNFHYMIDSERHVLSEHNNIEKINDSFYIYYPKENVLIKYFK